MKQVVPSGETKPGFSEDFQRRRTVCFMSRLGTLLDLNTKPLDCRKPDHITCGTAVNGNPDDRKTYQCLEIGAQVLSWVLQLELDRSAQ